MFFGKLRILKEEPCPCGSGKNFVHCCYKRIGIPNQSRKPIDVQLMEGLRSSLLKRCMHPDQVHCKGKIKKAHALQNNKIMNLLGGSDRHVYILDTKKRPLIIPLDDGTTIPFVKISKVSVNEATTETCFCDYHDSSIFSIIEKDAPVFNPNNKEMGFVYAYKSFIFEYYKILVAIKNFQKCFYSNPIAYLNKKNIAYYRMLQQNEREFNIVNNFFSEKILLKKYDGIFTCALRIPKKILFANYAYIAPDFDLDGKKIKNKKSGILHRLSVTVFPEESQSWILLSCMESELDFYEAFLNQIKSANIEKVMYYFNTVLPLYSENIVISPQLWESWDTQTQMAYTYLANLVESDAKVMSVGMKFMLKNISKSQDINAYKEVGKINLFA